MTLSRATPRKHLEWPHLINALVEIRHHNRVLRTGYVEDAMADSSVVWIAADRNQPRQMFEAAQGHEVWVTSQKLDGDLSYRMTRHQIFQTARTR
jgi:hypothetical protein